MNEPLAIKIQAYLDGELSQEDTNQLLTELESSSDGKELLEALQSERSLLGAAMEKDHSLPVAHSYFWKGIAKGMGEELEPSTGVQSRSEIEPWKRWLSWLLPAVGAACVALVALQQGLIAPPQTEGEHSTLHHAPSFHEIDSGQQNAGFISFRSETEGVSVVWISND